MNINQTGKDYSPHILLYFASIAPANRSRAEIRMRIQDYRISIQQCLRLMPSGWTLILCENTLQSNDDKIIQNLGLLDYNVVISMSENNKGEVNKGLGELNMMTEAYKNHQNLIESAQTVSYFTGRRLMTSQYLFERSASMSKSALISNPDFIYLDGKIVKSEKNSMFNDMFFTMRSSVFSSYVSYFRSFASNIIPSSLGSEQILFNFISKNKIEFEWLNYLGLIRWEYESVFGFWKRGKLHLC
jgi:hypothetical protein